MAQFRNTADILDTILRRAGEETNGNSAYEAEALEYLNKVHHAIIAGGSVFNLEVDESWVWARSKSPMTIELQPKYETGTVSVTQGSEAATFSSAPSFSAEGWFLKADNRPEAYKIVSHTAAASAFELDAAFVGDTAATQAYKIFKLDYELVPSYLTVDSDNNKIDFEETASTELTATLTEGSYTPADLATEVKTQMDAAGASTYTVTYDAVRKTFDIASDRAGGGGIFTLQFATGSNNANSAAALLGYDDEDLADAATQAALYPLGAVSRIIEPVRANRDSQRDALIEGIDSWRFLQEFPVHKAPEKLPTYFTKIEEDQDGRVVVRFNAYPDELRKLELHWIPVPRDLKDNAKSRPLFPRNAIEVLEYGAAYHLLLEKEDNKAQLYLQLAQAGLKAMENRNREQLRKSDGKFGQIVPRIEQLERHLRNRFRYGYTAGD